MINYIFTVLYKTFFFNNNGCFGILWCCAYLNNEDIDEKKAKTEKDIEDIAAEAKYNKTRLLQIPIINAWALLRAKDEDMEEFSKRSQRKRFIYRIIEDIPQTIIAVMVLRDGGGSLFT